MYKGYITNNIGNVHLILLAKSLIIELQKYFYLGGAYGVVCAV
jgi:hypothetical protein